MSKLRPLNELSEAEQVAIKTILAKHPSERTDADNEHLQARKAYVNAKGTVNDEQEDEDFTDEDEQEDEPTVDLSKLSKDELKALALEKGLDTEGTKAELVERLQA